MVFSSNWCSWLVQNLVARNDMQIMCCIGFWCSPWKWRNLLGCVLILVIYHDISTITLLNLRINQLSQPWGSLLSSVHQGGSKCDEAQGVAESRDTWPDYRPVSHQNNPGCLGRFHSNDLRGKNPPVISSWVWQSPAGLENLDQSMWRHPPWTPKWSNETWRDNWYFQVW